MPAVAGPAGSRRGGSRQLTVVELLQQYAAEFVRCHRRQAVSQVQSTLAKLSLCRTAALGGRVLQCNSCDHEIIVYNSCGDRHCPQCGGAKRSDWVDKTAELLLPEVTYFQVVFTLPDCLSGLVLGNRRELYGLLMRSAWQALKEVLPQEQGIEPAAVLVLHTWNQQLEHHPHVHALVPGGGPSLDGKRWLTTRHPKHARRTKPYLANNRLLGEKFREHFCRELKRLHRKGRIALASSVVSSGDTVGFAEWVDQLAEVWNVFIEPPPERAQPEHAIKYLARYLTGGPISDRRLISHEQGPEGQGQVTILARSKNKQTGNRPRPFTLSGVEFLRRWSLHILPKGFTKIRRYGGFSSRHRRDYFARCRRLLEIAEEEPQAESQPQPTGDASDGERTCPRCQGVLICRESASRPSWRDVLGDQAIRPPWYQADRSFPCIRGPDRPRSALSCVSH